MGLFDMFTRKMADSLGRNKAAAAVWLLVKHVRESRQELYALLRRHNYHEFDEKDPARHCANALHAYGVATYSAAADDPTVDPNTRHAVKAMLAAMFEYHAHIFSENMLREAGRLAKFIQAREFEARHALGSDASEAEVVAFHFAHFIFTAPPPTDLLIEQVFYFMHALALSYGESLNNLTREVNEKIRKEIDKMGRPGDAVLWIE